MTIDYPGDPTLFPTNIPLIDDSDELDGAHIDLASEALADRTAFLIARVGAYRLVESTQHDFSDPSEASPTLVSWAGGAFGTAPLDQHSTTMPTLVGDIVLSYIYLAGVTTTAAATGSLRVYDSMAGGARTQLPGGSLILGPGLGTNFMIRTRRVIPIGSIGTYTIGIDGRLAVPASGEVLRVYGAYVFGTEIWRVQ